MKDKAVLTLGLIAFFPLAAAANPVRMSTDLFPLPAPVKALIPLDADGDGTEEIVVMYERPLRFQVVSFSDDEAPTTGEIQTLAGDQMSLPTTADLDGDGDEDIVLISTDSVAVHILLNAGDGTLVPHPKSPLPGIESVSAVEPTDINGDGSTDLLIAGRRFLTVYQGDGAGGFVPPVSVTSTGFDTAFDIAIADLRGAGSPTYAVLVSNKVYLYHLINNQLVEAQQLTISSFGRSLTTVDIGDGELAFLAAHSGRSAFDAIRYNSTSQVYGASTTTPSPTMMSVTSSSISNNPSRPLRAAFGFSGSASAVVLEKETAPDGAFFEAGGPLGSFHGLPAVTFRTVNNQQYEDLVYGSDNPPGLIVLKPAPDGWYDTHGNFRTLGFVPTQILPYGDSSDTFVITRIATPLKLATITPVGNTHQVVITDLEGTTSFSNLNRWQSGDINNDGLPDLVAIADASSNYRLRWQIQLPDGRFAPPAELFVSSWRINGFILEDMNADGHDDAVLLQFSGEAQVLYGTAGGTFANPVSLALSASTDPGNLAVGDFDADGRKDIACVSDSLSGGKLHVAYAAPGGGFEPRVDFPIPRGSSSALRSADSGDLDRDGLQDIALLSGSQTRVMFAAEGRSFRPPVTVSTSQNAASVRIADLDADGFPELISTFGSFSEIASRDGTDLLANKARFIHANFPLDAVFSRIDDDEVPDYFAISGSGPDAGASIFYNASPPFCAQDYNNDGEVNFFDISAFIQGFADRSPFADVNADGAFDFFDVAAFIDVFSNGCP